jgi:hydrogenase maturation protease
MQASKNRVLIIGYGNPLRGDDALGWELAGRLAATIRDETVEVLAVSQLTPELSALISEVELVIFIDASLVGQPGSWKCQTVDPNPRSSPVLGHHLTPMSLLGYAQAIYKVSPRTLLVSVAGNSFDCRQELTPCIAAALPAVEQFVRRQIAAVSEGSSLCPS